VVAVSLKKKGERGCAFVVPKAHTSLALAELTQFLAAQGMTKQYWPERLELVEERPRTPSGKIQKFRLREMAASLR